MIRAISFDFGNTLFPFGSREWTRVLTRVHAAACRQLGAVSVGDFSHAYYVIREEQTRRNLPQLVENSLEERLSLLLTRLWGPAAATWTDQLVAEHAAAVVDSLECPHYLPGFLGDVAADYRLAVISNFPYAPPIRAALERFGLAQHFQAIVVSAAVGRPKPHPLPFNVALAALGVDAAEAVHVGDDRQADLGGAAGVGMAAVLTDQWADPDDVPMVSGEPVPLPSLVPDGLTVQPLATIHRLTDLPAVLPR